MKVMSAFATGYLPCNGRNRQRYASGRYGSSHGLGRRNLKCSALLDRVAPRSGQRCRMFVVKKGLQLNEQTLSMRLERVAARENRFDYEIIVWSAPGR